MLSPQPIQQPRNKGSMFSTTVMTTTPNKRVETNRRPATPFDAERESEGTLCAPPFQPAAVAHSDRWPNFA